MTSPYVALKFYRKQPKIDIIKKIATSHKPGPCFAGDAFSGPNSNNTWEPLGAGGADTAEYPDSLDWYPR